MIMTTTSALLPERRSCSTGLGVEEGEGETAEDGLGEGCAEALGLGLAAAFTVTVKEATRSP